MMYQYLASKNIDALIKKDHLEDITEGDPTHVKETEAIAISQIKSALNNRYDLVKIFPTIHTWREATTFKADAYCYHGGKIFKATEEHYGSKPGTTGAKWEEEEPRDSLLMMIATDIMLYHLHARVNRRQIPQYRFDRYQEAKQWLEDVKAGLENPELPLKEEPHAGNINWGSNPQMNHYF
jgi:hypothetical protein